jgi:hypothetical protein
MSQGQCVSGQNLRRVGGVSYKAVQDGGGTGEGWSTGKGQGSGMSSAVRQGEPRQECLAVNWEPGIE